MGHRGDRSSAPTGLEVDPLALSRLAASGLIAGEALMGLGVAAVVGLRSEHAFWNVASLAKLAPWLALPVAAFLIWHLIAVPLRKAGAADEPAPPTAVM